MNKSTMKALVLGVAMAFGSMPLYAQSASDTPVTVATVKTDGGVVMIKERGDFVTALPDQRVGVSAQLMVSEQSSATVVHDDGCQQKYDKPGVYPIGATCTRPVAAVGGMSTPLIVGAVIVGGVAAYQAVKSDDDDRPPVSR